MKNLGQMMKQAQEMQSKMNEMQNKLSEMEVTGSSGAGMIKITLNGKNDVKKIKIDRSAINPGDAEVLEDLIVAAVNQALQNAGKAAEEKMSSITGGLAGKKKLPDMV